RQWGRGSGPRALLACVPGEAHDISLIAFGLMLRSYGWRIVFLGADTPLSTLAQTAEATRPALTVLSIFEPALLEQNARALRRLAKAVPLALSGPGASEARCASLGIRRLDGDLIAAAHEVAGESAERPGV
ncbi:MAG: cobalamin B12-binding domain-containing protein, partial [Actinomycetota bacterium]|nr:cobalamin B12-binding domain-containing protein [Actinomycetota bacterium]